MLFDLDGTIIDSARDITAAITVTLEQCGLPVPDAETLRSFVGPPLLDTLHSVLSGDDALAAKVLTMYRAEYARTALHSPVFPGMSGLLEQLHRAGIPVALATSKPERMAREILTARGLADCFTVIAGASDDERGSRKAEVVADALERLRAESVDTSAPIMVGDRGYDTEGALANGVPTILVEWGYGSPEEAGAAYDTVHSVDQLRAVLTATH